MANRRRTKNYFPYPGFQLRYLAFLLGGALVQVVVVCAVLAYFLRQNYELLVKFGGLDQEISRILYGELRFMTWVVAATCVTYLAGLTVLGVLFSHRIAGPIFAIKRTIREINAGKDVALRFRKYDEFLDLADDFNRMIRRLRDDQKKVSQG